jgi:hypothetical protein
LAFKYINTAMIWTTISKATLRRPGAQKVQGVPTA